MVTLKTLIEIGCSEDFASEAMYYKAMYSGDLEAFVCSVEEMLQGDRKLNKIDLEPSLKPGDAFDTDAGIKRVEKDYNGDLLTYHGYEFIRGNRRL